MMAFDGIAAAHRGREGEPARHTRASKRDLRKPEILGKPAPICEEFRSRAIATTTEEAEET